VTSILLDQGLAPGAAALLREGGFDAVHVMEIGLDQAEDLDKLAAAAAQNRICVTLDHDFHTHLALAAQGRPSVILLRIEGIGAAAQAELIAAVCLNCEAALNDGAAVSADGHSVRFAVCLCLRTGCYRLNSEWPKITGQCRD
jgi:predicted nuclease of predicted toxin-antitoxin system